MMKVKVKIIGVFKETHKAMLVKLPTFAEVWIPYSLISRKVKGNYILVEKWLCDKNKIPYKDYINKPNKIKAIPNQEAIDELKL